MALYGVLGDIHGNLEALRAVLAAFDARGVGELLCVGDVVGYNADPDECATLLWERGARVIAGNHDLIATQRLGFERCSNKARYALQRTRRCLEARTVEWLERLPRTMLVEDEIALVHGGVCDVQLYMKTPQLVARNAALLREDFPAARVCFFGHSHAQKVYRVDGDAACELDLAAACALSPFALERAALHFVNPGSVDAQRKSGPRLAEGALFDSAAWTVELFSVPYEAAATEAKAAVAGYRIPALTDRLYTWRRRLSFV